MNILVIGSEGNIGYRLVPLLKLNHNVMRADQVQGYNDDYVVCNILNIGDLIQVFKKTKPDVVFLLAAMVSRLTCEQSPYLTVDTNITGLNNVIQLCKSFDAKLIYFSTSEVYGNIGGYLSEDRDCKPNNLYGLTKYLGEKLVEYELTNGLNAFIVRPFMFYDECETVGNHRSAMIRFVEALSAKKKIVVHKNSKRSWLHMIDAVKVIEQTIFLPFNIMNIGSNELVETEQLAQIICSELGLNPDDYIIKVPLPEKMTLEKYPDVRKQIELTGIEPTITLNEGVKRVINRFK